MNWKLWLKGLVAAFIGGAAGALESGLALIIIDPEHFNLGPGLVSMIKVTTIMAALVGIKVAAAYLKQSPAPNGAALPSRKP